jgi:hypothetical protein
MVMMMMAAMMMMTMMVGMLIIIIFSFLFYLGDDMTNYLKGYVKGILIMEIML